LPIVKESEGRKSASPAHFSRKLLLPSELALGGLRYFNF